MRTVLVLALAACAASPTDGGRQDDLFQPPQDEGSSGQATVRVIGQLAEQHPVSLRPPPPGDGFDCPDDSNGGVSANLTPKTYALAIRKLTLLGAEGTDDVVIMEEEDSSQVTALELTTDGTTLGEAIGAAAPGSYDGMEMEIWWMDMALTMVIEDHSSQPSAYMTSGWFADVDPMAQRDVSFAITDSDSGETADYWIDRDDWTLASTSETRPDRVLDLWADDDFWAQDPVTLSTRSEDGNEFRFTYDGDAIEIPEDSDADITITMGFDISGRMSWWEYLPDDDASQADGVFTVGEDCGFRLLFPDVSVTVEEN